MLRRFRPSPALVVALISLFVALGGVSYAAATKIGTRQIANGAVTAKKLHKNAVTTKKIRTAAVTGNKLANHSVGAAKVDSSIVTAYTGGVAIAGANIGLNGSVRRFFNRASSGAPTVSHPQKGLYQVVFPGLVAKVGKRTSISTATIISDTGEIRVASAGGNAVVRTANSDGAAANRAFNLVIFYRSP